MWYITCGGGGAPYYSEEATPWTEHWGQHAQPRYGYYYSSQENVLILEATETGIALKAFNPYGEPIDAVDNLMAIKQ